MLFSTTCVAIIDTCRKLADKGFLAGTGGNIALRADDEHIVVTPSASDYYTMTPNDVCLIRLSDLRQVTGDKKPSVETGLHARMLSARKDCNACIHTHQPIASAYTLLARPLEIQSPADRQLLGEQVPCAGYAPSGTTWLARKVERCVRPDVHAYLMRNHGVVCVGSDVEVAMQRVAALERVCALFFQQQLVGRYEALPAGLAAVVRDTLSRHLADDVSETHA